MNEGDLVKIIAEEYKEKMEGMVGTIISRLDPQKGEVTGDNIVFRVEFFCNLHKIPKNMPRYWLEDDLQSI